MDVSVVIVNWNSRDYLQTCLSSVFAQTTRVRFEVVVIDSASFDGSETMVRERFPSVRFIQSADNLGFARANNRASLECRGECLLFLNPDTELVGPAIDTLFDTLVSLPDGGIVGCRLLNSDGTIQSTSVQALPTILNKLLDADALKRRWPRSRLWGMAPLYSSVDRVHEAQAISGACLMLKRRLFEAVGRFSEDYFMYAEDVDLSHKVKSAGYKNYYTPLATVVHHGGSSSSKATVSTFAAVMMPEATRRFLRKTRGDRYARCYRAGMGISALGRLMALGLVVPFCALGRRNAPWRASVRKWLAIFTWSLGTHDLVRKYYPT